MTWPPLDDDATERADLASRLSDDDLTALCCRPTTLGDEQFDCGRRSFNVCASRLGLESRRSAVNPRAGARPLLGGGQESTSRGGTDDGDGATASLTRLCRDMYSCTANTAVNSQLMNEMNVMASDGPYV